MKRVVFGALALVLLISALALTGCGDFNINNPSPTPLPANRGNLVFSVDFSKLSGSNFLQSMNKKFSSSSIPTNTTDVDIYIYNSTISGFSPVFVTIPRAGETTVTKSVSVPSGANYQVQVLAADKNNSNLILASGQVNNISVTANKNTAVDVSLSPSMNDSSWVTSPPVTVESGKSISCSLQLKHYFDINLDYLSAGVMPYSFFLSFFTSDYSQELVLPYTGALSGMWRAGTNKTITFTGTAPTVNQNTIYNCLGWFIGFKQWISQKEYVYCTPFATPPQTTITPASGDGTIGIIIH